MQAAIIATGDTLSRAKAGKAIPAVLAGFLGLFMMWGVGLSDISAVHNAAHDVRHTVGFPCH